MDSETNARKQVLKRKEALELAAQVDEIFAAKRKKVIHLRMADVPGDDSVASALLGPTGNLRAPTLHKDRTLIVGFNQEVYESVLGS